MKFLKERVYTALNADELKIGSKVIVADSLASLKNIVECAAPQQDIYHTIIDILPDDNLYRFIANKQTEWALAYLVSEPEEKKLKWTDLKIGDVIRYKESGVEYLVTGLDKQCTGHHIYAANTWINDDSLEKNWEKVEE